MAPSRRRVLAGIGTAVGMAGCTRQSASGPTGSTVTDAVGRSVTLPATADEIVCIGPGLLRQAVYMGLTDRVVGVENIPEPAYDDIPYLLAHPELADRPIVGESGADRTGNPEQLLAVDPDVIFFHGDRTQAETLSTQTETPVVMVSYDRINDQSARHRLVDTWQLIGRVTDTRERADTLATFLEETVTDLRERTADLAPSERAHAYAGAFRYQGAHGLSTTRSDTTAFTLAGVADAIDGLAVDRSAVSISHERLLVADPKRIFIDVMSVDRVRQEIAENPEFRQLTAVETGQVYPLLPVFRDMRNFGSILANAYYVGSVVYPDRFADVDVARRADTIYETLLRTSVYETITTVFPQTFQALYGD